MASIRLSERDRGAEPGGGEPEGLQVSKRLGAALAGGRTSRGLDPRAETRLAPVAAPGVLVEAVLAPPHGDGDVGAADFRDRDLVGGAAVPVQGDDVADCDVQRWQQVHASEYSTVVAGVQRSPPTRTPLPLSAIGVTSGNTEYADGTFVEAYFAPLAKIAANYGATLS